jgi:hypothetical protein
MLTLNEVRSITKRFSVTQDRGPTEKVFWMHAMEKSTEILFAPKIRAIVENKFQFYINQSDGMQSTLTKDKNRIKTKMDKAGLMRVFREVFKDNESALELMHAVLEHIFAIKLSRVKTKLENMVEIDLDDFQAYLLNYLLAPSKERILHTAFTLYRAISRKKICNFDNQANQPKEAISAISEIAELSTSD